MYYTVLLYKWLCSTCTLRYQVSLSLVYNQGESQHDMKLSLYGVCFCVCATKQYFCLSESWIVDFCLLCLHMYSGTLNTCVPKCVQISEFVQIKIGHWLKTELCSNTLIEGTPVDKIPITATVWNSWGFSLTVQGFQKYKVKLHWLMNSF